MKDPIERQMAINSVHSCVDFCDDGDTDVSYLVELIVACLQDLPSVEKVGKWIKHNDKASWYCSECNTDDYYAYAWNCDTGEYELQDNYCPTCGARMYEAEK